MLSTSVSTASTFTMLTVLTIKISVMMTPCGITWLSIMRAGQNYGQYFQGVVVQPSWPLLR